MKDTRIIVCVHVMDGKQPEVLSGDTTLTDFAVCYECADAIDAELPGCQKLLRAICQSHAAERGIPTTLPGAYGFWQLHDGEFIRQPDIEPAKA